MFLFERNTPRWIIFFIDIAICFSSLVLAYLLRFNFSIPQVEIESFPIVFGYIIFLRALSFYFSKTYQGIVRYTSSKDGQRIFIVITIGSIFLLLTNAVTYNFINLKYLIPFSIIIIDYMATTFMMIAWRIIFKALYFELTNPTKEKSNVIIFGAGEAGLITKRTLDRDAGTKYKVLAFIDEGKHFENKTLEGVSIYGFSKLSELIKQNSVAHVIISVQNLSGQKKQEIVDACLNTNTKILNVPPVKKWINGELSFKQIKKIRIEDLLEREPIKLNEENIKKQLENKIVLITGAAGPIGSEIARQLIKFKPQKLILLDQAESALYELEMELNDLNQDTLFEVVIADIRNRSRMEHVFKSFHPNTVFHAAAYKHVPLMENNPSESILTNIFGTKILADFSVKYNVEKFVMVSTDKAVKPTNVMGASKRVAEMYVQSLSKNSSTKFVTTRFGNVLDSNGSVIRRFSKQIENRGPITVTHPEITRFFMTIPEACQLVLEAGTMGNGGEIFIFNMGRTVKILELAQKMIKLSGLQVDKDIKIIFTGLRPGEKLFEELLNDKENTLPTYHPLIMIANVKQYDFAFVSEQVEELVSLFDNQKNLEMVSKLKYMVPEFKSNNSVYEQLDTIDIN